MLIHKKTLSSLFVGPYRIGQLKPETLNTTAVRLTWEKPLEYKPEYTYWVRTMGCVSQNQTVAGEVAEISELPPGTNCTFCVFVRAANGIKGEASCTSQYTSKTCHFCFLVVVFYCHGDCSALILPPPHINRA